MCSDSDCLQNIGHGLNPTRVLLYNEPFVGSKLPSRYLEPCEERVQETLLQVLIFQGYNFAYA